MRSMSIRISMRPFHRAEAGQVLVRDRHAELRRRPDVVLVSVSTSETAIHHDADHAARHVEDDHHGLVVVQRTLPRSNFEAQVHDRDDHAAQVGHALDELGALAMRVTVS